MLRRDEFRRQVEQMPRVAWALLEELSRRLRDADAKITGLVLLDVPGRVARLVLDRAEGDPPRVERPPTHEVIAQMIGASRETVSRAMKELQEAGLVRAERRLITVLDAAGLARRAAPGAGARAARAERAERAADAEAALLLDDEDAPAGADDATRGGDAAATSAPTDVDPGMEPAASEADGDAARAPAR
jgi:DNA-binding transcriptional MocR family regulator